MNLKKARGIIIWVAAWILTIMLVKYLGVKGFIGFIAGVIIATVSCTAAMLKYSDTFFTAAKVFVGGLTDGKNTQDNKR